MNSVKSCKFHGMDLNLRLFYVLISCFFSTIAVFTLRRGLSPAPGDPSDGEVVQVSCPKFALSLSVRMDYVVICYVCIAVNC